MRDRRESSKTETIQVVILLAMSAVCKVKTDCETSHWTLKKKLTRAGNECWMNVLWRQGASRWIVMQRMFGAFKSASFASPWPAFQKPWSCKEWYLVQVRKKLVAFASQENICRKYSRRVKSIIYSRNAIAQQKQAKSAERFWFLFLPNSCTFRSIHNKAIISYVMTGFWLTFHPSQSEGSIDH